MGEIQKQTPQIIFVQPLAFVIVISVKLYIASNFPVSSLYTASLTSFVLTPEFGGRITVQTRPSFFSETISFTLYFSLNLSMAALLSGDKKL